MGYEVTEEQLARTVDYYLARTSHGSTLSSVVTAWVLARYDSAEAWQWQHPLLSWSATTLWTCTQVSGWMIAGAANL